MQAEFAPHGLKGLFPSIGFRDAPRATCPGKETSLTDPRKEAPRVPDPAEEMP